MRCDFLFISLVSLFFQNVLSLPYAPADQPTGSSKATDDATPPKLTTKVANAKLLPAQTTLDEHLRTPNQDQGLGGLVVPVGLLAGIVGGGWVYRKEIGSALNGFILGFDPAKAQMDRLPKLIPKSHPQYAAIKGCVEQLMMDDLRDEATEPSTPPKPPFSWKSLFGKQDKPPPPKVKWTLQTAFDECIRTNPECQVTDPYIVHYPGKHVASPCSVEINAKHVKTSGDLSKYKEQKQVRWGVGAGATGRRKGVVYGRNPNMNPNVAGRRQKQKPTQYVAEGVEGTMKDAFRSQTHNLATGLGKIYEGEENFEVGAGAGARSRGVSTMRSSAGANIRGLVKTLGTARKMGRFPPIL
ncbi:MAG: hypothetical protein M1823_005882 [Watsoniomyces obsoletus]|nr:MAG: hypothetical protein M1823_005882 [Watsoniomyces obsoletus]